MQLLLHPDVPELVISAGRTQDTAAFGIGHEGHRLPRQMVAEPERPARVGVRTRSEAQLAAEHERYQRRRRGVDRIGQRDLGARPHQQDYGDR